MSQPRSTKEQTPSLLSAETAAGRYPVEAVAMMNRIACRVQEDPLYFSMLEGSRLEHEHTAPDAISAAACQVARWWARPPSFPTRIRLRPLYGPRANDLKRHTGADIKPQHARRLAILWASIACIRAT